MKRRFKATIYLQVETESDRLTSKQAKHAACWQCHNAYMNEYRRSRKQEQSA